MRLQNNLILADAAETKICVLLSISTLLGVSRCMLTGAAWLEPLAVSSSLLSPSTKAGKPGKANRSRKTMMATTKTRH